MLRKIIVDKRLSLSLGSSLIAITLPFIVLVKLPGTLIDFLIIGSFVASLILLIIMLENDDPLNVTFLPTVILLLTTFRLLLSIATTRNIVANEDVGSVIESIGEFVLSGNIISGLLIFVIITIVQFLVVTKGGERVAEVGARFSLDALPGRQMTIDGDLKAGLIDGQTAQKLRADLNTENKMFGSLDGAMKFVKGDSIAGILISLVNLFGGIYIGVNQLGLSVDESVSRFSILTIGDGLVSQIPSLLLSMACGVYLTRIQTSQEASSSFIKQMTKQIGEFWKSTLAVSLIMLFIGIFNNELLIPLTTFGLLGIMLTIYLARNDSSVESEVDMSKGIGVFDTLSFKIKDPAHVDIVKKALEELKKKIWNIEVGNPALTIAESEDDIVVETFGLVRCRYRFNNLETTNSKVIELGEGFMCYESEKMEDNLYAIIFHYLSEHLKSKYNLKYTNALLSSMTGTDEVIKNEVESSIGLNRVHELIKEVLYCPEFYLDKDTFFESLLYWSQTDVEPEEWLSRIRSNARFEISYNAFYTNDHAVPIIVLQESELEKIKHIVDNGFWHSKEHLVLKKAIYYSFRHYLETYQVSPVLVVSPGDINICRKFFGTIVAAVKICSPEEVVEQEALNHTLPILTLGEDNE